MEYVALGKTNLMVSRSAFGTLPLQLVSDAEEAAEIIREAWNGGINFFDASRNVPVSEEYLGNAIKGIRRDVFISTKTSATTALELHTDLNASLDALMTDRIDLYQLENLAFVPQKDSADGVYNELLSAKEEGRIKHIGFSTSSLDLAHEAVESGLYETIQYPFNFLSDNNDNLFMNYCAQNDIGFIAIKPLSSGQINDISLAYGYLHQFENILPVWGIKSKENIQKLLYFETHPPVIDEKFKKDLEAARNSRFVDNIK